MPDDTAIGAQLRMDRAIHHVASSFAIDSGLAVTQAQDLRQRLREASAPGTGHQPLLELVVQYSGHHRRLAFLSPGPRAESADRNLMASLRLGLKWFLDQGGSPEHAGLLADSVRIAFPDFSALERYTTEAQVLLLVLACRAKANEPPAMKAYLNTRLFSRPGHNRRVTQLVTDITGAEAGAVAVALDLLYDRRWGAKFMGVGIDVHGASNPGRAKMYVRVPGEQAEGHLRQLAGAFDIPIEEQWSTLVAYTPGSLWANEVEIAVAFRRTKVSLKFTPFFPTKMHIPAVLPAVTALLTAYGYEGETLAALVAILSTGEGRGPRPGCIHGVGVEFPQGPTPKINLYLQAAL